MDCSKWMKMLIEWFLAPNQRVNQYRTEVTSKTQTTQGFVKEKKKTWWFINSINMTVEILNSKVMSTYFAEWVRLINRERKKRNTWADLKWLPNKVFLSLTTGILQTFAEEMSETFEIRGVKIFKNVGTHSFSTVKGNWYLNYKGQLWQLPIQFNSNGQFGCYLRSSIFSSRWEKVTISESLLFKTVVNNCVAKQNSPVFFNHLR